jgi:hypothetical protein
MKYGKYLMCGLLTVMADANLFVLLSFNPPDFVQEAANQAIHDVAANQYRCVW